MMATTSTTPVLLALHTTPTGNGVNVSTLADAMVRVLCARRDALLAEVASIESELGKSPTTAEIREKYRRGQGKCKECGAEW